jgi:glycogen(starch) synthase
MRICLISREYPPDTGWGGVGAYTYQIAHGLRERGHEVHVVCLAGNAGTTVDLDEDGVKVHRVAYKNILDELNLFLVSAPSTHYVVASLIAMWRRFVQLHKEYNFDVAEVPEHLAGGLFQALTGCVPTVVKLHTPHSKFVAQQFHNVSPNFDNQLICLLERLTMRAAEALSSPSKDMAKFVADDLGIAVEGISIVRNPADLARFSADGAKAIESAEPLILFVGRLEERKGVRFLAEAIPTIHARFPDARFVFIGADTNTAPGGTSMLSYLKKQVAGCASAVQFLGHVPLQDIPSYYRSADICVVPSLYDNAPYTCIEAMSCGRPVVATTAGGTAEYVANEQFGLVVPPADPNAIADALCKLLANEMVRKQYGIAAREFVETHLDRRHIASQMEVIYAETIASFQAKHALYAKPVDTALKDALDLLCAFDANVFDTLYAQSLDFRIRHWLRFFRKRPALAAAGVASSVLHKIYRSNQPAFLNRLDASIASRTPARYNLTMLLADELNVRPIDSRGSTSLPQRTQEECGLTARS